MGHINTNIENIDELITAYHLQTASKEQNENLLNWLKESEENKKYFQKASNIWHYTAAFKSERNHTASSAFEEFSNTTINPQAKGKSISLKVMQWAAAAAVLTFVFIGGIKFTESEIHLTAYSNAVTDTLPDGTIVTLNKNSELSYHQFAFWGNRSVIMNGEVYFDVAKNKAKPFIISARDINVEVVGTAFNINANTDNVSVLVEEGIVNVTLKGDPSINERLTAGNSIYLNVDNNSLTVEESFNSNQLVWKTHQINFADAPLIEVIEILEGIYNVTINTSDSTELHRKLNASFSDTTDIQIIQKVIQLSLGIELEIKK